MTAGDSCPSNPPPIIKMRRFHTVGNSRVTEAAAAGEFEGVKPHSRRIDKAS